MVTLTAGRPFISLSYLTTSPSPSPQEASPLSTLSLNHTLAELDLAPRLQQELVLPELRSTAARQLSLAGSIRDLLHVLHHLFESRPQRRLNLHPATVMLTRCLLLSPKQDYLVI